MLIQHLVYGLSARARRNACRHQLPPFTASEVRTIRFNHVNAKVTRLLINTPIYTLLARTFFWASSTLDDQVMTEELWYMPHRI